MAPELYFLRRDDDGQAPLYRAGVRLAATAMNALIHDLYGLAPILLCHFWTRSIHFI